MVRNIVLLCVTMLLIGSGCASKSYLPQEAEFDPHFLGIWQGELSHESSPNLRRWQKKRRSGGALFINMSIYDQHMNYLGKEKLSGFWWVEEKQYFEKLPGFNHMVVTHSFEVREDGSIDFTVITGSADSQTAYSFNEHKVGDL